MLCSHFLSVKVFNKLMGSPYSLRIDPDTGKTRDVFATFKGTGNGWQFRGYCFRYETEERGTEPDYIKNL